MNILRYVQTKWKYFEKIPFQPFCDCIENKCSKNTDFTWEVARNAMANIFPSDSVGVRGSAYLDNTPHSTG